MAKYIEFPNPALNWQPVEPYRYGESEDPKLASMLADYMAKLDTYGTADALALHFAEAGIKAQPGQADSCAIAEHAAMTMDLPDDVTVRVGAGAISLMRVTEVERTLDYGTLGKPEMGTTTFTDQTIVAHVPHGPVTERFVNAYDEFKYPDIVDDIVLAARTKKLAALKAAAEACGTTPKVEWADPAKPTIATFADLAAKIKSDMALSADLLPVMPAVDYSAVPQRYLVGASAE